MLLASGGAEGSVGHRHTIGNKGKRVMNRCVLAMVLVIAAAGNVVLGQQPTSTSKPKLEPKSLAILGQSLQKYRQARSYSHTEQVSVTMTVNGQERKHDATMTLAYQRPNKIAGHWTSAGLDVVCDGKTYRAVQASLRQYIERPAPATMSEALLKEAFMTDQALPPVLSALVVDDPLGQITKDVSALSYGGVVDVEGVKMHLLELEQPGGTGTLWIDVDSMLIRKLQFSGGTAQSGQQWLVTTDYKDVKVDQPIEQSVYKFDIPPRFQKVTGFSYTRMAGYEQEGQPLPAIRLTDISGKPVVLNQLPGKVKIFSFWATWCPPCMKELPLLEQLYQQFKDKDVLIAGINDEPKKSLPAIKSTIKQLKVTFPMLLDSQSKTTSYFKVHFIPMLVIVGPDGRIVEAHKGFAPQSKKEIIKLINKLLGQSSTSGPARR